MKTKKHLCYCYHCDKWYTRLYCNVSVCKHDRHNGYILFQRDNETRLEGMYRLRAHIIEELQNAGIVR